MLSLNKIIDWLDMENCEYWYGHVLRREDDPVLRRGLLLEVEGQRKKAAKKDMEEAC